MKLTCKSDCLQMVDVGCGIGGSSRHISKKFGCRAEGITLSPVQVLLAFVSYHATLNTKSTATLMTNAQGNIPDCGAAHAAAAAAAAAAAISWHDIASSIHMHDTTSCSKHVSAMALTLYTAGRQGQQHITKSRPRWESKLSGSRCAAPAFQRWAV